MTNWPYTLTIIENLDHSFRILIQSYYINDHLSIINNARNSQFYFSLTEEQMKYLKDYEIINIAERIDEKKEYRIDEDPTRNISRKNRIFFHYNSIANGMKIGRKINHQCVFINSLK